MNDDFFKQKLSEYLAVRKPFGENAILEVTKLTDGKSSNHLNYKVRTLDGSFVARIVKPGDLFSYANLSDEFTLLKLIELYDVGPKAVAIDLEHFDFPIFFEEFIDGNACSQIDIGTEEIFEAVLNLIIAVGNIPIDHGRFPFKFSYTGYRTNFRAWSVRMDEIDQKLGADNVFTVAYRKIAKQAEERLEKVDGILFSSPIHFIYNDVHPGNTFLLSDCKKAKFIDWQKVSLGDPSFMAALWARRFGFLWRMTNYDFEQKVLQSYMRRVSITDFENLFYSRMLERAVSDMIWVLWKAVRSGRSVEIQQAEENIYVEEARGRLAFLR